MGNKNRMDDDNIFDKDDALDYIIYRDLEATSKENVREKGGCLGLIIIISVPVYLLIHHLNNI